MRPAPSHRILFTSPSLRVPGILQSRFLSRIGGTTRIRDSLAAALADGSHGVTAKIRWLASPAARLPDVDTSEEGRSRWIHCTPLLGHTGAVGVWMVVLVDDERDGGTPRRFRTAPPVARDIGSPSRASGSVRASSAGWDDAMDGETLSRSVSRSGFVMTREGQPYSPWGFGRPESAMSQQRAASPAFGTGGEPSINSFALG